MRKLIDEKTVYWIMIAWCLLPVIMGLYCILTALTGRFTPAMDGVMSINCLFVQVLTYHFAFLVLGCVTIIISICCIIQRRKQMFSILHVHQNPWIYLFLAILIWSVFSTIFSDNFINAFRGERYRFTGLLSYFIFAGVFVCALMIQKERYRRNIIRLFCGVQAYLSVLIIIQCHTKTFLDYAFPSDYATVFAQHNHLAYLVCMGIIGCTGLYLLDETKSRVGRILYLLGLVIQLYALLINTTFGSYLAALIAMPILYIFYFRSGRSFKPSVFLPALLFIGLSIVDCFPVLPVDAPLIEKIRSFLGDVRDVGTGSINAIHAGTGRGILWKQTIERALQRPLFGFGPDGFYGENAIISHDGVTHDSPHNEFLQMAGFTGIPSLVFYLVALLTLAVHHWKKLKELNPMIIVASGVTVTYLFSAFFGMPVFYTHPYLWLFLGLISVQFHPGSDGEENEPVVSQKKGQVKYGNVTMTLLLCVLATGVLFLYSLWKAAEYIAEQADLQAMWNADLTVQMWDDRDMLTKTGDYWYDATSYQLYPADETPPSAYGIGTIFNGEGIDSFNQTYLTDYAYDAYIDYTDKVILVHVVGLGDNLGIKMEWVSVR